MKTFQIEQLQQNEGEEEEESENKKRERLLFELAIQPVAYYGRAQLLKKLEEQNNRHSK